MGAQNAFIASWHSSRLMCAAIARPGTEPSTIPWAFACESMKAQSHRADTGNAISEDVAMDECSLL